MAIGGGKGEKLKKIIIIGGGLGGLTAANLLARSGFQVQLVEKKRYPFHRVCGEYISNEVKDFLIRSGLYPDIEPSSFNEFIYTSTKGSSHKMPLDLGAFGVSRYVLDEFLAKKARSTGVEVFEGTDVLNIEKEGNNFHVYTKNGDHLIADFVIGAFGKTSSLDRTLKRNFITKESPYIGVKYHIKTDFPKNQIALHNFKSGYCGISAIEEEKYNLCYLGQRSVLKTHKSIEEMEENVLCQNPFLKEIFNNSEFLFDKPEVINAFSFKPKEPVVNGIFMVGDAAGLITPLCGNGMAMAIHSAKILAELIDENHDKGHDWLTEKYSHTWKKTFAKRLWFGRQVQRLFGSGPSSEIAVSLMKNSPFVARQIMKNTHGQPV